MYRRQGSRPSPWKKKCKKSKMAVWGGLTSSCEKKRGEKERYKHLNVEFQRIAREIRKPCSVINAKKQENNRMGKTRDLFEKIRDTKGPFHAKMGTIKDRNSLDLEKQKKLRSGKNTQKNYTKRILSTRITTMV